MPWIESHDNLESHPKLLALASAMQWNEFETSGRLHAFWKWCLRFAPTGDLHKYNDAVIGKAVVLNGDAATRFVEAMTSEQSCWIDRGSGPEGQSIFRVHDWPDYTKKYLRDSLFRDRPEKWKEVLDVYSVPLKSYSRVNHHGRAAPYLPTVPTVPTRDKQTNSAGAFPKLDAVLAYAELHAIPKAEAEKFWHHYESMGWIDKNGNPIRNWQSKLMVWRTEARQQKPGTSDGEGDFWKDKARLDLVEKSIAAIEARASHTAMDVVIQPQDKAKYAQLRADRKQLKARLKL